EDRIYDRIRYCLGLQRWQEECAVLLVALEKWRPCVPLGNKGGSDLIRFVSMFQFEAQSFVKAENGSLGRVVVHHLGGLNISSDEGDSDDVSVVGTDHARQKLLSEIEVREDVDVVHKIEVSGRGFKDSFTAADS